MKLVKEHINFTRGLDPKDAMSIGDMYERIKHQIKSAIIPIAKEFNGYGVKDMTGKNSIKFQFYKQYSKEIWSFYIMNELYDDFVEWGCGWCLKRAVYDPDSWCLKRAVYDPDRPGDEHYLNSLEDCVDDLRRQLKWRKSNGKFNEAQHFTRGLDPKDAMSVGIKANLIKKYGNQFGNEVAEAYFILMPYLEKSGFNLIDEDLLPPIQLTFENSTKNSIQISQKETMKNGIHSCRIYIHGDAFSFVENKTRFDFENIQKLIDQWDDLFTYTLTEAQHFTRGLDPKDAMSVGDVQGRKIEKAKQEIYEAIKQLAKENKIDINTIEWPYDGIGLGFTMPGSFIYFIDYDREDTFFGAGMEGKDSVVVDYTQFPTVRQCMKQIRNWIIDEQEKE